MPGLCDSSSREKPRAHLELERTRSRQEAVLHLQAARTSDDAVAGELRRRAAELVYPIRTSRRGRQGMGPRPAKAS